jgi:serine/threonine protein phosphatase PrpC
MAITARHPTAAGTEIEAGACTDTGRVRKINEDSFAVAEEISLFVLSDGMGGHASGEVASRLTVDSILAHCRAAEENPSLELSGYRIPGVTEASNRLASAIRLANLTVYEAALKHVRAPDSKRTGMGATVVAAQFVEGRATVAHVGDSRAYRLRGDTFKQLTEDHSFIAEQVRRGMLTEQEARRSNLQNVLVRALGVETEVLVDVREEIVLEDDTFLLCSDGLTRELSDTQIAAVLKDADGADNAAACLVDLANQAGGGDNITAVVLRCAPKAVGAFGQAARLGRWFRGSR